MSDDAYRTETVTFPEHSAPEVVETLEIEGKKITVVRYATMIKVPATKGEAPEFGYHDKFTAVDADAIYQPSWVTFYVNGNDFRQPGAQASCMPVARVAGREYATGATARATVRAARDRIERDRLHEQYAPVAEANIGVHTLAEFQALDADAAIEPGDLVVVYSHKKYRTGVAIKVTATRVECLAATPSGGYAQGTKGTRRGDEVRLLRKVAPAAPVAPAVEQPAPAPAETPVAELPAGPSEDARQVLDQVLTEPEMDAAEERRCVAGRLFARGEGMADAGDGCTLYRMVRARVGAREMRIHDDRGELLGTVIESAEGWRAETPAGERIPMFVSAVPGGWFGRFTDAVDAVRVAASGQESDDQGAVEATPGEGGSVDRKPTPAEAVRTQLGPLLPRLAEPEVVRALADLLDPAVLRAAADQVELQRRGHVTEIEVDGVGQFGWSCVQGDAEETGYDVGEDAYRAATAHGPLAAGSLFGRGPVVEHEGRGDNEHGVPRRALAGSLHYDEYEREWVLESHGRTGDVGEGDVVGAQAWAARLLARGRYDADQVDVARWEHHRDRWGQWWEPVVR